MTEVTRPRSGLRLPAVRWRSELLHVAYAGMEVSWLTPLFLALLEPARRFSPYGTALVLGGLMLAFYAWSRIAYEFQLGLAQERLVMLLALPVIILVAWRVILHPGLPLLDMSWIRTAGYSMVIEGSGGYWIIMITVLFLWWRGLALSRREFTFESVAFGFRLGLLLLVTGTLLLSFAVGHQVMAFIFPFFFFSLVSVSLSRLEEVGQVKGYVGRLFDFYWLGVLGVAISLILLVGAVFTVLARPASIETLRALWAPLGDALIEAITGLLGILLAPFEPLLVWLAGIFAQGWALLAESQFAQTLQDLQPAAQQQEQAAATPYIEVAFEVVRVLCGAGLLIALLLAGLWLLNRERKRLREQAEEHAAMDVSLLDALAGLARNAQNRLRSAVSMLTQFGVGSDLMAAISVRNIYANTTRLARRRGYPRHQARTPYEYLPDLQTAFPAAQAEAQAITDAYVAVHYGEVPTTREEMAELRAAFERLKASPEISGRLDAPDSD